MADPGGDASPPANQFQQCLEKFFHNFKLLRFNNNSYALRCVYTQNAMQLFGEALVTLPEKYVVLPEKYVAELVR